MNGSSNFTAHLYHFFANNRQIFHLVVLMGAKLEINFSHIHVGIPFKMINHHQHVYLALHGDGVIQFGQ